MLGIEVGGNFDASASWLGLASSASRSSGSLYVCMCVPVYIRVCCYIQTKKFVLSNNTNLYSISDLKETRISYILFHVFVIYPTVFAAQTTVASGCTLDKDLSMIHELIDRWCCLLLLYIYIIHCILYFCFFKYLRTNTQVFVHVYACFVYRQRALYTLYVIDRHNLSKLQYYEYNIMQYLYIYKFNIFRLLESSTNFELSLKDDTRFPDAKQTDPTAPITNRTINKKTVNSADVGNFNRQLLLCRGM